jgi:hypothetical protein
LIKRSGIALGFVQIAGDPNPMVASLGGLAEGVFAELRERVVGLR